MRRIFALTLLTASASLACDATLGSIAAPETGSEGDDPTSGDGDGDAQPFACIGGQLCPEGTSCANGLCVVECSDDSDCASDEFCGMDGLCHPDTIPTCNHDDDCAVTQTCVNQVCSAPGNDGCDPENYLQDGCASNAVCIADYEDEQGSCQQMPACADDGSCPTGLEGAVCNDGYLPTKDLICLVGLCDTVANCPNPWSCVRYDNAVLGYCSDGGFASPCTIDAHCLSGSCVTLPGLGGGVCG